MLKRLGKWKRDDNHRNMIAKPGKRVLLSRLEIDGSAIISFIIHHLEISMPVVLRVAGFKFFFYQADMANEPPHVHVTKEGNEAKFWLDPVRVAREGRFRKSDLRDIERIIENNLRVSLESLERGEKQTC